MTEKNKELEDALAELQESKTDKAIVYGKAISGAIPLGIGGVLSEIVSSFIPNQRMDRVVAFLKLLSKRLSEVEVKVLRENNFSNDILQESMVSASKALNDVRYAYLSNITLASIDIDERIYGVKKLLLQTLSELTDFEVQVLQDIAKDGINAARKKYHAPRKSHYGNQQYLELEESVRQELALLESSYPFVIQKLLRLNLLEEQQKKPSIDRATMSAEDIYKALQIVAKGDKELRPSYLAKHLLRDIGL